MASGSRDITPVGGMSDDETAGRMEGKLVY